MDATSPVDVDSQFIDLLTSLGIEGQRKQAFLSLPTEQKTTMLNAHRRTQKPPASELLEKINATRARFGKHCGMGDVKEGIETLNGIRLAIITLTESDIDILVESGLIEEVLEFITMICPAEWPGARTYSSTQDNNPNRPLLKLLTPAVRCLNTLIRSPTAVKYITMKGAILDTLLERFPSRYTVVSEFILDVALKTLRETGPLVLKSFFTTNAKEESTHAMCIPLCSMRLKQIIDELYYNTSLGNATEDLVCKFLELLANLHEGMPLQGLMLDSFLRLCEVGRLLAKIQQKMPQCKAPADRLIEVQRECRRRIEELDARALDVKDNREKEALASVINIVSILFSINSRKVNDVLEFIRSQVLGEVGTVNDQKEVREEVQKERAEEQEREKQKETEKKLSSLFSSALSEVRVPPLPSSLEPISSLQRSSGVAAPPINSGISPPPPPPLSRSKPPGGIGGGALRKGSLPPPPNVPIPRPLGVATEAMGLGKECDSLPLLSKMPAPPVSRLPLPPGGKDRAKGSLPTPPMGIPRPDVAKTGARAAYVEKAKGLCPAHAAPLNLSLHARKPKEGLWTKLEAKDLSIFKKEDFVPLAKAAAGAKDVAPPAAQREARECFSMPKKKCNAIDIALARVKIPLQDLVASGRSLNCKHYTETLIVQLLANYPTEEEARAIGECEPRTRPEIFFKAALSISWFRERLLSMHLQLTAPSLSETVICDLEKLISAYRVLLLDEGVHALLRMSLSAVNVINAGGRHEGAWGLRLESLGKILQNKKLSLLIGSKAAALKLPLKPAAEAMKVALTVSLDLVESEYKDYASKRASICRALREEEFLARAMEPTLSALDALENAHSRWADVAEKVKAYYGEPAITEDTFLTVANFILHFKQNR